MSRLIAGAILAVGVIGGAVLAAAALTAPVESPEVATAELPPAGAVPLLLPNDRVARPVDGPSTLVLHDPALPAGDVLEHNPELGATFVANLAGHFGPVDTAPVHTYAAGDGDAYAAVVYVGAWGTGDGDNELPQAFLDDVTAGSLDLLWLGAGADQLAASHPDFAGAYGWEPASGPGLIPDTVQYKRVDLPRDPRSLPIHPVTVLDATLLTTLATAQTTEGAVPYAVRSRNLTYVAEVPFGFLSEANHSLVVADLLFDLVEPQRPERHRALVRLEDIGPTSNPDRLREAADVLSERGIPFAFAVYPIWRDPLAQYEHGDNIGLGNRPDLVDALRYLQARGGTMVMHGVTHQLGERPNPDTGVSGEDYEFYLVESAADDGRLTHLSPIEAESREWIRSRIQRGLTGFELAGFEPPAMFEFPHYLGSPLAYRTLAPIFDARYERTAYFPGLLTGTVEATAPRTQYFPYPVHDVYGEDVVPENLGNVTVDSLSGGEPRSQEDLIGAAERLLVVRDGVASFFYHPFLGTEELGQIVDRIEGLGYEFVSAEAVLEEWR